MYLTLYHMPSWQEWNPLTDVPLTDVPLTDVPLTNVPMTLLCSAIFFNGDAKTVELECLSLSFAVILGLRT